MSTNETGLTNGLINATPEPGVLTNQNPITESQVQYDASLLDDIDASDSQNTTANRSNCG